MLAASPASAACRRVSSNSDWARKDSLLATHMASIVSDADDYVGEVVGALRARGVRAEADLRNEKINYKVREHSLGKVPVILAIGAREVEERTVTVRRLGQKQTQVVALDEILAELGQSALPPDLGGPGAADQAAA